MRPMLTIKCRTLIIVISVSSILTACVMPEAIPTASAPRIGSDPVSNATECESTFSYPNDSNGKPYVFCWQPYGSACATFVSGIRVALVQDSQARPPIVGQSIGKSISIITIQRPVKHQTCTHLSTLHRPMRTKYLTLNIRFLLI
jgi:hypothetical protein